LPDQPPHNMHHVMSLFALPPPWCRGGAQRGLSAAGWSIGLFVLFTRGGCRRFIRGGQIVTPLLTLFIGGGVIIGRINLDGRLLGIQIFGCGGLITQAQLNTRLGNFSVVPIAVAMYCLYAAGAAQLETHFRGSALLLPFLPATCGPFDGINVLGKWEGAHIGKNTLLLCVMWGRQNLLCRVVLALGRFHGQTCIH
jgi:hypothetical protein